MKKQLFRNIILCIIFTSSITFCSETPQPSYWKRFTTWISSSNMQQARENAIRTALYPITWGFALSHDLTAEQIIGLYGIQASIIHRALQTKGSVSWNDMKTALTTGLIAAGTVAVTKPFLYKLNKYAKEHHTPHPRRTLKDTIDDVRVLFEDNEFYETTQLKIDAIERLKKYYTEEILRRNQNPKLGPINNLETGIQACDIVIKELKENK